MARLEAFKKVMDEVYGKFEGTTWKPKPYQDNKSRYLWTDAFGVCNYITLYYETGNRSYLDAADHLISDVHDTLGKDRSGQRRLDQATEEEPLKGGLRIGKPNPEGTSDGDGQYFHYNTKWMFALNRMSLARQNPKYNNWAIQMARSCHPHFVYNRDTPSPHMHWKISIDMSHATVPSEGNLDPFDGYVTYRILQATSGDSSVLKTEIADMEKMVNNKFRYYNSNDPLDLGESLWLSHWFPAEPWAQKLSTEAATSLENLWNRGEFHGPSKYRLAFREFGTTLGTQVNSVTRGRWHSRVEQLHEFWSKNLYMRDRDITPMMYCSSLVPGVWYSEYTKLSGK